MRWDHLLAKRMQAQQELPLGMPQLVERTFPTPAFAGMTFYEVRARSIINRIAKTSHMPFQWTLNPYRGCTHKCRYCFARPTHDYLGMNIGEDFDTKIVVKVNAPQLLKAELARPSWVQEPIAMGTNVDPYQRAEGKYKLMRGILEVLGERRNPFSLLTKGTLVLRDLDLLLHAAKRTQVRVAMSIGTMDTAMWKQTEAGAPSPRARVDACRTLNEAGIGCNVLMAPILPYLTDSDEQLEATILALASAGATSITPLALHLRPGVKEWFMLWLKEARPDLVLSYESLYRRGAYVPSTYSTQLSERVAQIKQAHGIGRRRSFSRRYRQEDVKVAREEKPSEETSHAFTKQLSLL